MTGFAKWTGRSAWLAAAAKAKATPVPKPIPQGRVGGAASVWNPPARPPMPTYHPNVPAAPGGAAPGQAAPAAPAQRPTPGYQDSTYLGSVQGLMDQINRQRTGITTQGERDDADFQTALTRLGEQRAQSLAGANVSANKSGLFYSGILGKARGDINHGYDQQTDDQTTAHDRNLSDRRAALEALGELHADPNSASGFAGTGNAGQSLLDFIAQAQGRAIDANQNLAAPEPVVANTPPATVAPAAHPALPPATPKPGYQFIQTVGPRTGHSYNIQTIGNRQYKVYANGDRVLA